MSEESDDSASRVGELSTFHCVRPLGQVLEQNSDLKDSLGQTVGSNKG